MNEQKTVFTFSKVTAILCAVTALFCLIAFFSGSMMQPIKYINRQIESTKESIIESEEYITELQAEIEAYEASITAKQTELAEAQAAIETAKADVTTAYDALKKANTDLDAVCARSYYSSYFCEGECKALHDAVSTCSDAYTKANGVVAQCEAAVEDINYAIASINENIQSCKSSISRTESRIADLKAELKELKGELTGAWFSLILNFLLMIVVIAALGLFAKNFYIGTIDNNVLYSCGGLAAASALYMIIGAVNETVPLGKFFINPHFWNLVTMGCFIAVLKGDVQKPVRMRTFAIIAAVLTGVFGFVSGNAFVAALYAATMICTAFVLVPLVFTEYISIAKHIFLTVITLGIWLLVWTFHVAKNLNKVKAAEARRPGLELFFSMFLPLYYLYWLLKTAETVEFYGEENDRIFKLETLAIAFGLICPLFSTILIQNKINLIVGKPVPAEPELPAPAEEAAPAEEPSPAEEAAPAEAE